MEKILNVIKDVRLIFALFGISLASLANFVVNLQPLIAKYNYIVVAVEIVILLIIVSYVSSKTKHVHIDISYKLEQAEKNLLEVIIGLKKDVVKYRVKYLSAELKDLKIISHEYTIMQIYSLEEDLKKLEINSYTQAMIEDMKSRIKIR